jgi:tetratricopeptide (TPR) repeat protein
MNNLMRARAQSPGDQRLWTMMSFGYAQSRETRPLAEASALVVQGLEAQSSDKLEEASTALEQALPSLQDPASVAFVQERLGDVAGQRGEHREAVEHYTSAIAVQLETLPQAEAAANADLRANSERLARALELGGASPRACRTLQRANAAGVEAPETARTVCSQRGLWRATATREPTLNTATPVPTNPPPNRLELQRVPVLPPPPIRPPAP